VRPIAHLNETQVYALARHLGVPVEVLERTPTTDTYSLAQTQEEFYFSLPHEQLDLCLWAVDHDVPAEQAAPVVGLTQEQVERVYRDIEAKRRVARYLHHVPAPYARA
jgi:NAD+ synthase